jgi:serine/threonine protein kinase
MSTIPTGDQAVIKATVERFRAAWKEGQRPRIEAFLVEIDESSWPPLLQELIRLESELCRVAGDPTSPEEYRHRFPACAGAIESLFGADPARSGNAARRSELLTAEVTIGEGPSVSSSLPAELTSHPVYQILRELGRGGMGVVCLARNSLLGRDEVLKVIGRKIVDEPGMMDRFLREIRAVARLRHPNIVAAYSAFHCGGTLVFSMEYVDGLDLRRVVQARGPLPIAQSCNYAYQAALGLQHAHEQGMVHRDIKPSNPMLSHERNRAMIKLLDFGLAKATSEQTAIELASAERLQQRDFGECLTGVGQMIGTPDFMAPEQIADAQQADIRADIYGLGCTLYCLLTGQPPFHEMTLWDVLVAHASRDARPLIDVRADVPAELADLVSRMMAKGPRDRFQRPAEVAGALGPFFKKECAPLKSPAVGTASSIGRGNGAFLVEGQQAELAGEPAYAVMWDSKKPVANLVPRAGGGRTSDRDELPENELLPPRPGVTDPTPAEAPTADGGPLSLYRWPIIMTVIFLAVVAIGSGFATWFFSRIHVVDEADVKAAAKSDLGAGERTSRAAVPVPPPLGAPNTQDCGADG